MQKRTVSVRPPGYTRYTRKIPGWHDLQPGEKPLGWHKQFFISYNEHGVTICKHNPDGTVFPWTWGLSSQVEQVIVAPTHWLYHDHVIVLARAADGQPHLYDIPLIAAFDARELPWPEALKDHRICTVLRNIQHESEMICVSRDDDGYFYIHSLDSQSPKQEVLVLGPYQHYVGCHWLEPAKVLLFFQRTPNKIEGIAVDLIFGGGYALDVSEDALAFYPRQTESFDPSAYEYLNVSLNGESEYLEVSAHRGTHVEHFYFGAGGYNYETITLPGEFPVSLLENYFIPQTDESTRSLTLLVDGSLRTSAGRDFWLSGLPVQDLALQGDVLIVTTAGARYLYALEPKREVANKYETNPDIPPHFSKLSLPVWDYYLEYSGGKLPTSIRAFGDYYGDAERSTHIAAVFKDFVERLEIVGFEVHRAGEHQVILMTTSDGRQHMLSTQALTELWAESARRLEAEGILAQTRNAVRHFRQIHPLRPGTGIERRRAAAYSQHGGFQGLHELQPGEAFDPRDIDHNATARSGKVILRPKDAEQSSKVLIVIDARCHGEQTAREVAAAVLSATARGDRVTVFYGRRVFAPTRQRQPAWLKELTAAILSDAKRSPEYLSNKLIKKELKNGGHLVMFDYINKVSERITARRMKKLAGTHTRLTLNMQIPDTIETSAGIGLIPKLFGANLTWEERIKVVSGQAKARPGKKRPPITHPKHIYVSRRGTLEAWLRTLDERGTAASESPPLVVTIPTLVEGLKGLAFPANNEMRLLQAAFDNQLDEPWLWETLDDLDEAEKNKMIAEAQTLTLQTLKNAVAENEIEGLYPLFNVESKPEANPKLPVNIVKTLEALNPDTAPIHGFWDFHSNLLRLGSAKSRTELVKGWQTFEQNTRLIHPYLKALGKLINDPRKWTLNGKFYNPILDFAIQLVFHVRLANLVQKRGITQLIELARNVGHSILALSLSFIYLGANQTKWFMKVITAAGALLALVFGLTKILHPPSPDHTHTYAPAPFSSGAEDDEEPDYGPPLAQLDTELTYPDNYVVTGVNDQFDLTSATWEPAPQAANLTSAQTTGQFVTITSERSDRPEFHALNGSGEALIPVSSGAKTKGFYVESPAFDEWQADMKLTAQDLSALWKDQPELYGAWTALPEKYSLNPQTEEDLDSYKLGHPQLDLQDAIAWAEDYVREHGRYAPYDTVHRWEYRSLTWRAELGWLSGERNEVVAFAEDSVNGMCADHGNTINYVLRRFGFPAGMFDGYIVKGTEVSSTPHTANFVPVRRTDGSIYRLPVDHPFSKASEPYARDYEVPWSLLAKIGGVTAAAALGVALLIHSWRKKKAAKKLSAPEKPAAKVSEDGPQHADRSKEAGRRTGRTHGGTVDEAGLEVLPSGLLSEAELPRHFLAMPVEARYKANRVFNMLWALRLFGDDHRSDVLYRQFFGNGVAHYRGYELPHDSMETCFDHAYFQGLSETPPSPDELAEIMQRFFSQDEIFDEAPGLKTHLRSRLYHGGFPEEWLD